MDTILSTIFGGGIGQILGLVGTVVTGYFGQKNADRELEKLRIEVEAEQAMQTLQLEAQKELRQMETESEERMQEAEHEAEEREQAHDAFMASQVQATAQMTAPGVADWVKTLAASVRPVLTYFFTLLLTLTFIALAFSWIDTSTMAPEQVAMLRDTNAMISSMASMMITWWFGIRQSSRVNGKA